MADHTGLVFVPFNLAELDTIQTLLKTALNVVDGQDALDLNLVELLDRVQDASGQLCDA